MDYANQLGYMPLLAMSNPFNMGEKLKELRAIEVNDNLSSWQKFDQMGNLGTEATSNALINAATDGLVEGIAPTVINKITKYGDDVIKKINKSNFKSEIDWGNWNKEIVGNKKLIKEYKAIEKTSKADNTWMKNPDGSEFDGTPEQFVQQNSKNFKKAFPNGQDKTYRGSHGFMSYKGSLNSDNMRSGSIFTADKKAAQHYGGKDLIKYDDLSNNSGYHELYYPKNNNSLYLDNKGAGWKSLPKDFIPRPADYLDEYKDLKSASYNYRNTDEVAKYLEDQNINYATIDNIFDGTDVKREVIFNHKPGNYLKSAIGNNGMFDMTNPNIYKALVPAIAGTTAYGLQEKKNGGWLNQYGDGGDLKVSKDLNSQWLNNVETSKNFKFVTPTIKTKVNIENEFANAKAKSFQEAEQDLKYYTSKGLSIKEAQDIIKNSNKESDLLQSYIPQDALSKTLEISANPMASFKEKNKYGRVPDNVSTVNDISDPISIVDMGYQATIGALPTILSGTYNTIKHTTDGNYDKAAFSSLDALPAVGKIGKIMRKAKNTALNVPNIPHYLPKIRNGKIKLVEYENVIRVEPHNFEDIPKYNPVLNETQNTYHGRWGTVGDKNISQIKDYINGPQSKGEGAKKIMVKKIPKTLIEKTKGKNLPLEAKKMSYGIGDHNSYDHIVAENLLNQEERLLIENKLSHLPKYNDAINKIRKNTKLIDNTEALIPKNLVDNLRSSRNFVSDNNKDINKYLDNLKNESNFLGINKKYIPFNTSSDNWLSKFK